MILVNLTQFLFLATFSLVTDFRFILRSELIISILINYNMVKYFVGFEWQLNTFVFLV